jgi:hypothetical protein
MTWRMYWLALIVQVIAPMTAAAFGLRPHAAVTAAYYYYPVPVFAVPAVAPVYVAPAAGCVPPAGPATFAVPSPAPPATSPPPYGTPSPATPAGAPKPGVSESSSSSTAYYAGPTGAADPSVCTVAFWNRSDRDVTLLVDGQRWRLPRSKGLTLDLPRAFAWQTDGRDTHQEQVPADSPGMEIVIRR